MISLTLLYGIEGYFVGAVITQMLTSTYLLNLSISHSPLATTHRYRLGDPRPLSRLKDVSLLSYAANLTSMAWSRLPILIAGGFLSQDLIGAISAVQNLAFRLKIVNEAITIFVTPTLSRVYIQSRAAFKSTFRRELLEAIALNLGAAALVAGLWHWYGRLLVGPEKWHFIGSLFYAFIGIELLLAFTGLLQKFVIVPAKRTEGLVISYISLRTVSFVLLALLIVFDFPARLVIPVSLAIPAAALALCLSLRTKAVLASIGQSDLPAPSNP